MSFAGGTDDVGDANHLEERLCEETMGSHEAPCTPILREYSRSIPQYMKLGV